MTTQYAVFKGLPTGLTLTKKVFTADAPDTEVTGITGAVPERTNAKGEYVVAVTKSAVISGVHTIILFVGSTPIATGSRTFAGTDGETATTTPEAVELDPATRVKLDATQPDYAPATPAQVNAQVLDVLSVDTFAELVAPPAATSSLKDKITWLFMYARNKVTQTATTRTLYRDDTTTVAGTSGTSDNGTTFTKGEDA